MGLGTVAALIKAMTRKTDTELAQVKTDITKIADVETPYGFRWTDHPLVNHIRRSNNGIVCDFDVASLKQTTGKTYYVSPSGNDSNTGTDREHPLTKIKTALSKDDVDIVVLMDGIYNINRLPQHINGLARSVTIVADTNAKPILCTNENVTISKTDGYTYVYQFAMNTNCIYDVANDCAYVRVLSISDVDSTEGSFYVDNGTTTYVHAIGDGEPTNNTIKACKNYDNFRITASGAISIYLEGITVCGGSYGAFRVTSDGTNAPNVYAKNCRFYGSLVNGAVYLEGCNSIMQSCEAAIGTDDGFCYHAKTNAIPKAIEINCEGHHNGVDGGTDNGSTIHDGGSIIRVNGKYHNNRGPNVHDVHASTQSWNIGCKSYKSDSGTQDNANSDFVVSADDSTMWLDSCSAYGSTYSLLANSTGKVYEHNNAFVTKKVTENCAIESY